MIFVGWKQKKYFLLSALLYRFGNIRYVLLWPFVKLKFFRFVFVNVILIERGKFKFHRTDKLTAVGCLFNVSKRKIMITQTRFRNVPRNYKILLNLKYFVFLHLSCTLLTVPSVFFFFWSKEMKIIAHILHVSLIY